MATTIQLLNRNIRDDDATSRRFSQLEIDVGGEPGPDGRPTVEQFGAFQAMYDHFNRTLFDGRLPPVILNFSRRARTYGFFAPKRWNNGDARTHEISLNPSYLKTRPGREVASTLVHEMAHLWQQEYGTPSRTGYHNTEWAAKMEAIGLQPTDTGQAGGRRVGQNMTHLVIDGGPFDQAFGRMSAMCYLPWQCQPEEGDVPTRPAPVTVVTGPDGTTTTTTTPAPLKSKNKVKYTCPGCGANVWGKPGLELVHAPCVRLLEVVG